VKIFGAAFFKQEFIGALKYPELATGFVAGLHPAVDLSAYNSAFSVDEIFNNRKCILSFQEAQFPEINELPCIEPGQKQRTIPAGKIRQTAKKILEEKLGLQGCNLIRIRILIQG
jgi:hypothetical protein